MKNIDSIGHVRGESIYVDDLALREGTLFALVFDADIAHAKIKSIDYSKALELPGVVDVLDHKDIKGINQIGGIIPDEPLFGNDHIHFWGMPIALVVAESEFICRKAKKLIEIEYEELPVVTDPRAAQKNNDLIIPPRTFKLGDADQAFAECDYVFEGRAYSNGQEQLYLETQGAYAFPMENGSIKISSSTQGPTAVQKTAARVLGLPMHKIEVDVTRIGGGFGGKEDQATAWAVMAALAAQKLNRPVKYILHRMDDMRITGKRHPYSSDYKIGLDKNLKIKAYQAKFFQNAGAAADLSPAVMERTMFHATNSYFIPNVEVTAYSCRTNLPPNTAFRGFGGPQGMFVFECAMQHAANSLRIKRRMIQEKNLLAEGDEFPYGQIAERVEAKKAWDDSIEKFDLEKLEQEVDEFNENNKWYKKGIALMPVCFGISFTNTPMNHARALVHVYLDGSVGISTGGVEMGQGLNTKMVQVAATCFAISPDKIKIESTNTTRVANTSPSAASSTADLNGKALEIACHTILDRLKSYAASHFDVEAGNIKIEGEKLFYI